MHEIAALRAELATLRAAGKRIAFVATMGNLHAGHLSLVEQATRLADSVVASVFVNPLQFGPDEDFDSYPRTLGEDSNKLAPAGVDILFAPSVGEMYPDGVSPPTRIRVGDLGGHLCGAHREGHFDGMATVVVKLLNIVEPDIAVFGKKDFQQLAIIRQTVRDLCLSVEVVGAPTVRAEDGLALSSRNQYLSVAERASAPLLYATLNDIEKKLQAGERAFADLQQAARERLVQAGFEPDYVEIRRSADLAEPVASDTALVVLAAAQLGPARLIDNLEIDLAPTRSSVVQKL